MLSKANESLLSYSNFTCEQNEAIAHLYEHNECLLIAGKGFGKCAIAWTAAQELLEEGELTRVLVIAPPKVANLTWAKEWQVWSHLDEPGMATGDPEQRAKVIAGRAQVVVLSAESLPWFFKEYGSGHGFDGLIIDELTRFKSVGGQSFKAIRPHIPGFKWRVGLSATPVAEAGYHIYGQALLLDGGARLGRNKERFMTKYFVPDYSGYKWTPQYMAEERIAKALAGLVYMVDETDYKASLPPLVEQEMRVAVSDDIMSKYEELASTMLLEGVDVEAANAAVLAGKLQQVANGFVYDENGDTVYLHSIKFDALRSLLNAVKEPVVIVYQFKAELAVLKQMLPGAMVLGDRPAAAVEAWNAGLLEYLLIHPRSAGHGLNLQHGGRVMICLSPIWSSDQWDQIIGRIWRRGQTQRVTRYTLVAEGTIDGVILDRLAEKSSSESLLMEHLRAISPF